MSGNHSGSRASLYYLLLALGVVVGGLVYLLRQEQLIALDPEGFAGSGAALPLLFGLSVFVLGVTWALALFYAVRLWRHGAHDRAERRLGVLLYLTLLGLVSLLAWRYWQGYGAYLLAS